MAREIINQAGGHGGSRKGAGRPKGSRDAKTQRSQEGVAAVMARLPPDELLLLSPEDVLRVAMLVSLQQGDIEMAAAHARYLRLSWQPWMGSVKGAVGVVGGSGSAHVVNRLVGELAKSFGNEIPLSEPVMAEVVSSELLLADEHCEAWAAAGLQDDSDEEITTRLLLAWRQRT